MLKIAKINEIDTKAMLRLFEKKVFTQLVHTIICHLSLLKSAHQSMKLRLTQIFVVACLQ